MSLPRVRELPSPDRDDGAAHRLDPRVTVGTHACVCVLRKPYSAECVEGEFCEARADGKLHIRLAWK